MQESATVEMCMNSIKSKLKCVPLQLQLPVYKNTSATNKSGFSGVIDLVNMERLIFNPDTKNSDKYIVGKLTFLSDAIIL